MSKLGSVNTTDVVGAIRLACRCMSNVFNADDNNVPFFGSSVWPEASLGWSVNHSESHVPGRHLNGLLNAEDVTGEKIPDEIIKNHREAARLSYSGRLPLPLNRIELKGEPVRFCPHNIREGFHGLYALAKYRNDSWAVDTAEKSVTCILEFWDAKSGWDAEKIRAKGLDFVPSQSFIAGLGRSLGALVKYYKVTGSAKVMDLMGLLSEKLMTEFFGPDGRLDRELFGTHCHSITCCMSSLGQMGELHGDREMLGRVKAFYDNGLWGIRDEIGWSYESVNQPEQKESDHGEANNSGDILETALILGRLGHGEYYGDAERIIRAHLLPSQLRDVSFIKEPENPDGVDGLTNVADRHRGAWGFPAPYGHNSIGKGRGGVSFNMDIVGGVTGSLCEAQRSAVMRDASGLNVNLLFDYSGEDIRVRSPYTNECLGITLAKASRLRIRIPQWVERETLEVSVNGGKWGYEGERIVLPGAAVGQEIQIRFGLAESDLKMVRNHIKPIRVRFRGDEVAAMDNHGAKFVFFDPF